MFFSAAERYASGAGNSGSEVRADAIPRRLQTLVRQSLWQRLHLSMFVSAFFFHVLWPSLLGVGNILVLAFHYWCRA